MMSTPTEKKQAQDAQQAPALLSVRSPVRWQVPGHGGGVCHGSERSLSGGSAAAAGSPARPPEGGACRGYHQVLKLSHYGSVLLSVSGTCSEAVNM